MTNQRLAEAYLARARELEDSAERLERTAPAAAGPQRRRDTTFLRREAAWWRAYAQTLVEAAA